MEIQYSRRFLGFILIALLVSQLVVLAQSGRNQETLTGAAPEIDWNKQNYKYWTLSANSTPTYSNVPTNITEVRFMELQVIQPPGQNYTITTNDVQWQGTSWNALPSNTTNTIVLKWNGNTVLGYWVEQPAPGSLSGGGNVFSTGTPADRAIPIYNGTTGTNVFPSNVTIPDSNSIVAPGTVTIGTTNIAGALAGKQPGFTTGAGVTNIANVLSISLAPGTSITFSTNSGGVITINTSSAWDFDASGTTTNNTQTHIYTNALAANKQYAFIGYITSASSVLNDNTNSVYFVREAAYRNGTTTLTVGTNALTSISAATPAVAAGFIRSGQTVYLDVVGLSSATVSWIAKGHVFSESFSESQYFLAKNDGVFIYKNDNTPLIVNH